MTDETFEGKEMIDEESVNYTFLVNCAKMNFENLERARPDVAKDPYY